MTSPPHLPRSPWCCGSLQTAAIAIGFTDIVSSILLFLWYAQIIYTWDSFFVTIIVISTCIVVIVIVNGVLIAGALHQNKNMLFPWLILYLGIALTLLVYTSIKFDDLADFKAVTIASIFFIVYFYAVIVCFYHELKFKNIDEASDTSDKEAAKDLIDLEARQNAQQSAPADETFTNIAHRNTGLGSRLDLDESGEFAVPLMENSTSNFEAFDLSKSWLQKPDEVIPVGSVSQMEAENFSKASQVSIKSVTELSIQEVSSAASMPHVDPKDVSVDSVDQSSVARRRMGQPSASESQLLDIGVNFTPYKRKSDSEKALPKLKIFLPKTDDDSDEEEDSSSSSSDGLH